MTYAYGTAYKSEMAQNIAQIEGWNTKMFASTGHLKGISTSVNTFRSESRTTGEHVYRVAESLRRLGIVGEDGARSIRRALALMLVSSHATMNVSVMKSFYLQMKTWYTETEAVAETKALAATGAGLANIAIASSLAIGVASWFASYYAMYYVGRGSVEVQADINTPTGQRVIQSTMDQNNQAIQEVT